MSIQKNLYKVQNFWFNVFIVITYLLYILFAVGIFKNAPQYLELLDYYVKIYISLFLLWRFNPFRRIQFTDLDRKIAFSAGIFILTTTALNNYLINFKDKILQKIQYIKNKKNN